jgi:glycosyltransferase involved in cell wall biosynthesis
MDPLVSIVLPVYNGEKYISLAIDSILAQSFADFELIVVNDCSKDSTARVVDSYAAKDRRVHLHSNETNLKLPASLNAGFRLARGRFFTWTSDDNILQPHFLKTMVGELEQSPTIDLVYTNYTLIDDDGNSVGTKVLNDVNKAFASWEGGGASFLYKRQVHERNNGYNTGAFLIEDFDFFVRAFGEFRFQYLERTDLYHYRIHDASLSSTNGTIINDLQKMVLEKNREQIAAKITQQEQLDLYKKMYLYYFSKINSRHQYKKYIPLIRNISPLCMWWLIPKAFGLSLLKSLHSAYASIGAMFSK